MSKKWLDETIRREAISSGISPARLMGTTLERDTVFSLIYNGKEIARFDVRAPRRFVENRKGETYFMQKRYLFRKPLI